MTLCAHNFQILSREYWFINEILLFAGKQDINGETALMLLF